MTNVGVPLNPYCTCSQLLTWLRCAVVLGSKRRFCGVSVVETLRHDMV